MHGPSSSLVHPFTEFPQVPFVDSVLPVLSGPKRRKYKRARNRALALWGEAGFIFEQIDVADPPVYDPEDPDYPRWVMGPDGWPIPLGDEDAFMRGLLVPGAIHFLPMYENWVGSNVGATGYLFDTGGFAIWNMNRLLEMEPRYVVCHEMGHSIGLGHQYERLGGNPASVMYVSSQGFRGTSASPDAHDLLSLHSFYVKH